MMTRTPTTFQQYLTHKKNIKKPQQTPIIRHQAITKKRSNHPNKIMEIFPTLKQPINAVKKGRTKSSQKQWCQSSNK